MRSLFELISKYKSDVIIIPIIAFAAFVVSLFMYIFFNKKKIYKYIPGIIVALIGIIFFVQGYFELLNIAGLNFLNLATKLLSFAGISIIFSLIFDILDSLGRTTKSMFKKNKKERVKK